MSDKSAKELRKTLRQVVKQLLPEVLKESLVEAVSAIVRARLSEIDAEIKKALKDMQERQLNVQSMLVRDMTARQDFHAKNTTQGGI